MTALENPTRVFRLRTLGELDLHHPDGRTLRRVLVQPKRVALLAYLASNHPGRAESRDSLLALFWPDSSEKDARAALRQSIYFLRKSLGKEVLPSNGETLRLEEEYLRCDAVEFERAFGHGDLDAAMELYGGEFLPGLHLDGVAPELEFWLENRRVDLRDHAVEAARGLAQRALEDGEGFRAAEWARRAIALDPDDEESLQVLMTILDTIGDRTGAIRTYEEFAERIAGEYELEPSSETTALIESIRSRPQESFAPVLKGPAVDACAVDSREKAEPARVEPALRAARSRFDWGLPRGRRRLAAAAILVISLVTLTAIGHWTLGLLEAEDLPPTIVVFPFEVDGDEGADVWREGAVDLLSTQLDGALGLRAIDARTALARWRERVVAGERVDVEQILAIARELDAKYVVVGVAISGGGTTRLKADLYDTLSGKRLGGSVSVGDPTEPFALIDGVAVDVIKELFRIQGGGRPPARSMDVTTRSVEALRAYLDGEVLFRRSAFDQAVREYRRAVEADSTFALAWYRLSTAYGYTSGLLSDLPVDPIEDAMRYVDRLPDREALFLRSSRAFQQGTLEAVSLAHTAVQRYPDDPEAWYLLGEAYYHLGPPALVGAEESDRAFAKAVALDSLFTPAYIHMIHRAFNYYADSTRAARLIDAFARYEAGTLQDDRNRIAFGLVFGDDVHARAARAALDTLAPVDVRHIALNYLWNPRHLEIQQATLETRRATLPEWDGTLATLFLYFNAIQRGDLERVVKLQDDPYLPGRYRATGAYIARLVGLPVPPERLDELLAVSPRAETVDATEAFYQGAYAVDRGRWDDFDTTSQRLRGLREIAVAERDTVLAEFLSGAALGLEGYRDWKRGDVEIGQRKLEVAQRRAVGRSPRRWIVNSTLRLWLGTLCREREDTERAVRYFASLQSDDLLSVIGTQLLAQTIDGADGRSFARTGPDLTRRAR